MAFRLDRLTLAAIVDKAGRPAQAFQRLWQRTVETLEEQEAAQDDILAEILVVQAEILEVQAEQAALLEQILSVQRTDAISASYTVPSTVLTASDAGDGTATITIADHTRYYGDATTLAVTGTALTSLVYLTKYAIYYDDTTRADTTPTFVATTDIKTAQYNYAAGRHFVGEVITPDAGGTATEGGTTPPGGGGGGLTP